MSDKIMEIINSNEIYKILYEQDPMFKVQIDQLIGVADQDNDDLIYTIINMVYSFQSILTVVMETISQCGDMNTINAVNSALKFMLSDKDIEEEKEVDEDAE